VGFIPPLIVYKQGYLFESFLGYSLDEANTVNPPFVAEKRCIFNGGWRYSRRRSLQAENEARSGLPCFLCLLSRQSHGQGASNTAFPEGKYRIHLIAKRIPEHYKQW